MRRVPLLPTLLVLVAVGIMLKLGFWQLDRLSQKDALLARYAAAQGMMAPVPWPADSGEAVLYRRSRVDCRSVTGASSIAGQDAHGESGQAHVVDCRTAEGAVLRVVLGWSRDPRSPAWHGGVVTGTIAPGPRLVADPPLAGLAANARPDPSDIPNNHLAYAVQWFLFAATALVIYAIALWKRLAAAPSRG